jgi:transaldolase
VSPLLASDIQVSIEAAGRILGAARRENLLVKIPGTPAGVPAIEEAIFLGIPINVTLLFSCEQYLAAAEAYLRGIERRLAAGKSPAVGSVASLFVSRWDVAANKALPSAQHNRLGIAIGQQTYRAYRDLLASARWQKLAAAGAMPQRLLWASTGTKDPAASDTLYVSALAAPDTINTLPEKTLHAFADHGTLQSALANDGGNFKTVLEQVARAGVDVRELAERLQKEGEQSFIKSWEDLLTCIAHRAATVRDTSEDHVT